jgi:hypothetical protein
MPYDILMQKLIAFLGFVSANLFLTTSLVSATSFTITKGQTVTSAEKLSTTGQTGVVNTGGTLNVGGGTAAISFSVSTNGGSVSVTNSGLIEQTGTVAAGTASQAMVDTKGNTTITVTNQSGGVIQTSDADAINFSQGSNNVTVNNLGTITSSNASAGSNQAIDMNKITSGSNTVNNYSTGLIQTTESDAVRPGINGFVNNSGTIKSTTTTGSSSDGIDAQTNSGITITNAAGLGTGGANLIEGGRHGITGGNTSGTGVYAMTITNNAGGTIQGDNGSGVNVDGINGNELVTITNAGTITGNGHNISDGLSHDGDGVDVDGLVNLNNSGTIQSLNAYTPSGVEFSEGVTVGGGSITNSGTIEGSVTPGNTTAVGRGITLAGIDHDSNDNDFPIQSVYGSTTYPNPTITNSGTIKGDSESGIAVLGTTNNGTTATATVTITNNVGGKIEGNNTGVSEDAAIASGTYAGQLSGQSKNQAAIELDDASNTYVVNESGTIKQDNTSGGTAIAMYGVSNALNVTGGSASIIGNISGDTAADSTMTINPGAGNSFSYGYQISNFTVKINADGANGTVTLSAANTYSGSTTVSGGTAYIDNTSGSGTGTGAVSVSNGATLGGNGIIQPGSGKGITLASGGTLMSGGAQPATGANGRSTAVVGPGLTLDNTAAKGVIFDASVGGAGGANLTFSLGANNGGATSTFMKVLDDGGADAAGELKFATNDSFTLNDLTNGGLQLGINTPYLLIQATNDADYSGLTTTGDVNGQTNQDGYVTNVKLKGNITNYVGAQLYLSNGALEVVPEPGTWAMMLGGLAMLIFIQVRRCRLNT